MWKFVCFTGLEYISLEHNLVNAIIEFRLKTLMPEESIKRIVNLR